MTQQLSNNKILYAAQNPCSLLMGTISLWGSKSPHDKTCGSDGMDHALTHPKFKEKEMAPHPSTLAWKFPWMEEPDRLQPMGSLEVGHN